MRLIWNGCGVAYPNVESCEAHWTLGKVRCDMLGSFDSDIRVLHPSNITIIIINRILMINMTLTHAIAMARVSWNE